MIAGFRSPRQLFRDWSEGWLKRRLPRARTLTLNQRRIFILPTREGMGYLLMVAALFVGGINYANSLILGVSFLLVSLFLISILHTYRNLSGLHIEAGRSENAFAGEDALFLVNLGSRGQEYEALTLDWGCGRAQQVDLIGTTELVVKMLLPVSHRGRWSPPRLKVESCFPLGLLRAWSWIDLDTSCLVYPKPAAGEYPRRLSGAGPQGESLPAPGSDDFQGLRQYAAGDNPRHIAWKSYARSGDLHSKVFNSREETELWLEWEALAGLGVEERLSRLSYWVVRLQAEGRSWGLTLPGVRLAPAAGDQHMRACLERLSLYGLSDSGGGD